MLMLQGAAVRIVSTSYVKMEESVVAVMVWNTVIAPVATVACAVKDLIVKTTVLQ
jgi:hypothetical protein